jgi:putative chitinase
MPIHPKFADAVKALAAADASPAVIQGILDGEESLSGFGINTPRKAAHFLAQISHESGGFKIAIENMSYSAKRMTEVWKKRFPTLASAEPFAHNPEKLGNFVYANRMGNGAPESGDGFRYRGRGLIQMTGKDMYAQVGKIADLDLVAEPQLAESPEDAVEIAGAIWKIKKCDQLAENAPVARYTELINGGDIGLPDREKRFKTATAAMGV